MAEPLPLADISDPAEVLASDVVFDGRVWDVRRDRFRFGGHELTRDFIDHPGAVAVVARDGDGRILLINQYRHPIGQRDWELPAGLLDVEGEDPLAAAQRELAEEADLAAERWMPLIDIRTSPGGSSELIRIYLAEGVREVPAFARDDEEAEIVRQWETLGEVTEAILGGRLHNSILVIGALALHARGN